MMTKILESYANEWAQGYDTANDVANAINLSTPEWAGRVWDDAGRPHEVYVIGAEARGEKLVVWTNDFEVEVEVNWED